MNSNINTSTSLPKVEKLCEIINKKIEKIENGKDNVSCSLEASKLCIRNIFEGIQVTIDKWKTSLLKELDETSNLQLYPLEYLQEKLQMDRKVLVNTLFEAYVRQLLCTTDAEKEKITTAYLDKIRPIIFDLFKGVEVDMIPFQYIVNEDFMKIFKEESLSQLGKLKFSNIDCARFRLEHKDGWNVKSSAVFTIHSEDDQDINRFAKYFRWQVVVDGKPLETKQWMKNNVFAGFEFIIGSLEVHNISFFILNQHITGSPYSFLPEPKIDGRTQGFRRTFTNKGRNIKTSVSITNNMNSEKIARISPVVSITNGFGDASDKSIDAASSQSVSRIRRLSRTDFGAPLRRPHYVKPEEADFYVKNTDDRRYSSPDKASLYSDFLKGNENSRGELVEKPFSFLGIGNRHLNNR